MWVHLASLTLGNRCRHYHSSILDLDLEDVKLKSSEKYKFLICLACHNVVPTLSLLHHRNITQSSICTRCGDHDESFFHCVCEPWLQFSTVIWHKIGFSTPEFFSPTCAKEWIRNGTKGPRCYIFLVGLWWVWRHRNLMCLNNKTCSLFRLNSNIFSSAESITLSFQHERSASCTNCLIKSNNNNHICSILNVDGSCNGVPIRASFGGVLRNSADMYLTGFSGFIPHSNDILQAELTAIHRGHHRAIDIGRIYFTFKKEIDTVVPHRTFEKHTEITYPYK